MAIKKYKTNDSGRRGMIKPELRRNHIDFSRTLGA